MNRGRDLYAYIAIIGEEPDTIEVEFFHNTDAEAIIFVRNRMEIPNVIRITSKMKIEVFRFLKNGKLKQIW